MKKKEAMEHWKHLEENQPILPVMTAIPYGARGSRYGTCGIRIDGNPAFVDAVLSRLKDLLEGENSKTLISLNRSTIENVMDKNFVNKDDAAECCYIRLMERGNHGRILRAVISGTKSKRKAAAASTASLGL